MSLDFHKPLTSTKKMKKRKELDALVSSEKLSSKFGSSASNGGVAGSVNHRGNSAKLGGGDGISVGRKSSRQSQHQLLDESGTNSDNEMQQGEISGDGEVYAQLGERRYRRRQHGASCSACGRNCISFLSVCSCLFTVACIIAVVAMTWMQMEMRRELSLVREQCHKADKSDSDIMGDLILAKNSVASLTAKVDADSKLIASLQMSTESDRKSLDDLSASVATLKTASTTTSGLDNLPRDLEGLKKEVATVGSNVESIRTDAKQSASKISDLETKNVEIEKKLSTLLIGSQGVKDLNESVVIFRDDLAKVKSALFGNEKLESVDQRLEAVGERINVLSKTVADLPKSSADEATTETATSTTIIARTTQPTPLKPKNIVSAQPHEVTGVVGETTTSSSPASELASTSVAHQAKPDDSFSNIESLLAKKNKKEKP